MQPEQEKEVVNALVKLSRCCIYLAAISGACIIITIISFFNFRQKNPAARKVTQNSSIPPAQNAITSAGSSSARSIPADAWKAPDAGTIPSEKAAQMIHYGEQLVEHTALYFGPQGSIAHFTNGMNCQN